MSSAPVLHIQLLQLASASKVLIVNLNWKHSDWNCLKASADESLESSSMSHGSSWQHCCKCWWWWWCCFDCHCWWPQESGESIAAPPCHHCLLTTAPDPGLMLPWSVILVTRDTHQQCSTTCLISHGSLTTQMAKIMRIKNTSDYFQARRTLYFSCSNDNKKLWNLKACAIFLLSFDSPRLQSCDKSDGCVTRDE